MQSAGTQQTPASAPLNEDTAADKLAPGGEIAKILLAMWKFLIGFLFGRFVLGPLLWAAVVLAFLYWLYH